MLIWNFEVFLSRFELEFLFSNEIYDLKVAFCSKGLEKFWFAWYAFRMRSVVRMKQLDLRRIACALVGFCIRKTFRLKTWNLEGF